MLSLPLSNDGTIVMQSDSTTLGEVVIKAVLPMETQHARA